MTVVLFKVMETEPGVPPLSPVEMNLRPTPPDEPTRDEPPAVSLKLIAPAPVIDSAEPVAVLTSKPAAVVTAAPLAIMLCAVAITPEQVYVPGPLDEQAA